METDLTGGRTCSDLGRPALMSWGVGELDQCSPVFWGSVLEAVVTTPLQHPPLALFRPRGRRPQEREVRKTLAQWQRQNCYTKPSPFLETPLWHPSGISAQFDGSKASPNPPSQPHLRSPPAPRPVVPPQGVMPDPALQHHQGTSHPKACPSDTFGTPENSGQHETQAELIPKLTSIHPLLLPAGGGHPLFTRGTLGGLSSREGLPSWTGARIQPLLRAELCPSPVSSEVPARTLEMGNEWVRLKVRVGGWVAYG